MFRSLYKSFSLCADVSMVLLQKGHVILKEKSDIYTFLQLGHSNLILSLNMPLEISFLITLIFLLIET